MHASPVYGLLLGLVVVLVVGCQEPVPRSQANSGPPDGGPVTSKEKAVALAQAYAAQAGFAIPKNSNPTVTRLSSPENAVTLSSQAGDYRTRIRRTLEHKTYWMVLYKSGEELGGEYAFFLDEKTGAMLSHYAGK